MLYIFTVWSLRSGCKLREGKLITRWYGRFGTPHCGRLIIEDKRDDELNRLCRVARLVHLDKHQQPDLLPLYDVMLIYSSGHWLVLTGFERVESMAGRQDFAQSWICTA